MDKQSINVFMSGMNKDADKSLLGKDSYLDAHNFRIVTSEGASSGALENIKGNKLIGQNYLTSAGTIVTSNKYMVVVEPVNYDSADYYYGDIFTGTATTSFAGAGKILDLSSNKMLPSGQLICGAKRIRDTIVLFTTTNDMVVPTHSSGHSMIWTMTVNPSTEEIVSLTKIYDDSLNEDTGDDTLDFSTANMIKAVAKYETPNIQKIYWTDGHNNLRYMNIAANLTIDGTAYSSNNYMSVDKFELLPKARFVKPVLSKIIGGDVRTGMVAYSYQLYLLHGAETAFSPVSDMIHVTLDSDFSTHTLDYRGNVIPVSSGKGFVLKIDNTLNTGFNRLRLVRLHWENFNSVPTVSVANEIEIDSAGSVVYVTDAGNVLGSLTLDEFNLSSTEIFSCKDLESKDELLFASNIKTSDFVIQDWDARAVRFRPSSTAIVYDSSDNYATPLIIETDLSNWDDYVYDHDGVNKYNDADNDGNATYEGRFLADGVNLGAEGPNIKIDFDLEELILDDLGLGYTHGSTNSDPDNGSFGNYANPWNGGKLSWQRDEVYRLFVTFFNDRGQASDPMWICDLRMPSLFDGDYGKLAYVDSLNVITNRLYPRVWFKSFPVGAVSAQIGRVKRERKDRSVVTQALAIPTYYSGGGTDFRPDMLCKSDVYTPIVGSPQDGVTIVKLVSPEININRNIIKEATDYLEYVGTYNYNSGVDTVQFHNTEYTNRRWIYKCKEFTATTFSSDSRTPIISTLPVVPNLDPVYINNTKYINYCDSFGSGSVAYGSSGLLVYYSNGDWDAEGTTMSVVNYKADVYGSQYGGMTYEDRSYNNIIPCSDVITNIQTGIWKDINYGDTYICYFDVLDQLCDLAKSQTTKTYVEAVYIPLETSINCELAGGNSRINKVFSLDAIGNKYSWIMQEYAGEHTCVTTKYNQESDLYIYNTVYSQHQTARTYISVPEDVTKETEFDCMVKSSNKKSNGEFTDSWTKFGVNEWTEVDSAYGELRGLSVVADKLMFWQENAFGVISVNERSLIQDSNSSQLVLGTGGVLDRYDYISTGIGLVDKRALIPAGNSIFWFYDKDTSIYKFDVKLENLSRSKGMWSWFNSIYSSAYDVHGVYDGLYNEALFTFYKKSDGTGYTIAYSDQTDKFTSFYDFVPRMYIETTTDFLSVRDYGSGTHSLIFWQNSNLNARCRFYSLVSRSTADSQYTYPSTLKLLYNQDYPVSKVFDNVFYISNSYDGTVEIFNNTFDSIRCYNDYQNSDWVTLTYPTNVMRRERGWTTVVPRNIVKTDYDQFVDIFDNNNLDSVGTKTWQERIRDKYMVMDLSYNNSNGYRFVVPFMGVKYRISFR
jgi:hypothetical protein